MKPPRFVYEKPGSLTLAIKSLAAAGPKGRLRGGQTLGPPVLNLRLAILAQISDLSSIESLKKVGPKKMAEIIGCVTHTMIEDLPDASQMAALLSYSASTIAFRPNRGAWRFAAFRVQQPPLGRRHSPVVTPGTPCGLAVEPAVVT